MSDFLFVFKESLAGKSLPRIILNLELKKNPFPELNGKIMDLGSKSDSASYYRFLQIDKTANLNFCDFYCEGKNLKKIDLEKEFPQDVGKFDCLLCFNTMEHIYNYQNLVSESAKILEKDGRFICAVPFLYPYHADPYDYFRFTKSALKKIFADSGFRIEKIKSLGFGPFTLGFHIFPMPGFLRAIFQSMIYLFDQLSSFYWSKYRENFTLIYLFEAVKSSQ